MKKQALHKTIVLGLTAASFVFMAGSAMASGSMPSARTPTPNTQSTTSSSYEAGKSVYMDKISCSTCPVAAGVQDAAGAKALSMRVDANEFALTKSEKRSLKTFLKRRFEIK
jgi:hypothetical protein